IAAMIYGLSFVIFLLFLAPAAAVAYAIPGGWSAGGIVFAFIFAWSVKAAFLEPFAIACLLQVYFRTIEGQTPDPAWEARLTDLSGSFRKIRDRMPGGADRHAGPVQTATPA
ncbi:MAG: hypothetical protein ACK4QW_13630, partial [Alphaproteobacteria bacterium]